MSYSATNQNDLRASGQWINVTSYLDLDMRFSPQKLWQITTNHSFFATIHPLYHDRAISRADVRELIRRGLRKTRGSYKALNILFKNSPEDYKKFLNFLAVNKLKVDFHDFRKPPKGVRKR